MDKRRLLLDQLDRRMRAYTSIPPSHMPPTGWIKATRTALGMSLDQLGAKLGMTKQGVLQMEARETEGSLSIKNLREVANALDMALCIGFAPKDGTLDALVERKAREKATLIVNRTSKTMELEDQENTEERIHKAIAERTTVLKYDVPKMLWD